MLFDTLAVSLLLGLAGSALLAVLGTFAAQSKPHRISLPLHVAIAMTYLPVVLIVVDQLLVISRCNRDTVWVVVLLTSVTSMTLHALATLIVRVRRLANEFRNLSAGISSRKPPITAHLAYVLVNSTAASYRQIISDTERDTRTFAFIQRRIAPYMHSDEMLSAVAENRFGAGNPEKEAYVRAHQGRRTAFFRSLENGATYREIYPRDALINFVRTGTHSAELWPLTPAAVVDLLSSWRKAITMYPTYYVGICDDAAPIKYHVLDEDCVVLHEPIGKGDDIRMNSILIYSAAVGKQVAADFGLLWSLIDPAWRDRVKLARWIQEELIPLAKERAKKKRVG
jgi:hypothetical protein